MTAVLRDVLKRWPLVAKWGAGFIALNAVLFGVSRAGFPTRYLTWDPATIGHFEWWKGSLSMAGSMMWASAAMAFALAWFGRPADRSFFRAMTVVCLAMAADDTLKLHEGALPIIHVPEHLTYAVYGLGLLFVAWKHWRRALARHPVEILAFVAGLGTSIAMDVLYKGNEGSGLGFEDVPKVWGLIALTVFAFLEARDAIESRGTVADAESG